MEGEVPLNLVHAPRAPGRAFSSTGTVLPGLGSCPDSESRSPRAGSARCHCEACQCGGREAERASGARTIGRRWRPFLVRLWSGEEGPVREAPSAPGRWGSRRGATGRGRTGAAGSRNCGGTRGGLEGAGPGSLVSASAFLSGCWPDERPPAPPRLSPPPSAGPPARGPAAAETMWRRGARPPACLTWQWCSGTLSCPRRLGARQRLGRAQSDVTVLPLSSLSRPFWIEKPQAHV